MARVDESCAISLTLPPSPYLRSVPTMLLTSAPGILLIAVSVPFPFSPLFPTCMARQIPMLPFVLADALTPDSKKGAKITASRATFSGAESLMLLCSVALD